MKTLISLLAIAVTVTAGAAYGADDKTAAKKQPTAQQTRMKNCSAEAKEKALKKDERRAFMSSCLKGEKQ